MCGRNRQVLGVYWPAANLAKTVSFQFRESPCLKGIRQTGYSKSSSDLYMHSHGQAYLYTHVHVPSHNIPAIKNFLIHLIFFCKKVEFICMILSKYHLNGYSTMVESYFRDIFTIKELKQGQMRAMRTQWLTLISVMSNEKIETHKEERVNYEKAEECRVRVRGVGVGVETKCRK